MSDSTNPTNEVSIYGDNAILSSTAPSESELAMIEKASGVEVRDGDQLVDVEIPSEDDQTETTEDDQQQTEKKTEEATEGSDEQVQGKTTEAQTAQEEVAKDLQNKGVDVQGIHDRYTETGTMSSEDYAALEKAGYPKAVVDSLITGWTAAANSFTNTVLAYAGGEAEFKALAESAPAGTRSAFNAAVERGDLSTAKALLDGLKAARAARLGTKNVGIKGSPAGNTKAVKGFENRQAMTKAMSDPRYGRDTTYTKSVEAQVGASSFF